MSFKAGYLNKNMRKPPDRKAILSLEVDWILLSPNTSGYVLFKPTTFTPNCATYKGTARIRCGWARGSSLEVAENDPSPP